MERLPLLKPETVQAMAEPLLNAEQRKIFVGQDTMRLGMSYGHLMSVCVAPEESPVPLHLGEYGWDGKLGTVHQRPCNPQQPADDAAAQRPLGQTGQPARWRKENFVGMRG